MEAPGSRRLQGRYWAPQTTVQRRVAVAVPTPSTDEHAVVPARAVPEGARHNGPGPDDEFLVALAKSGRTDAYDQLVRRYRRFVRVKSSSYFLLGGDADDLMQDLDSSAVADHEHLVDALVAHVVQQVIGRDAAVHAGKRPKQRHQGRL